MVPNKFFSIVTHNPQTSPQSFPCLVRGDRREIRDEVTGPALIKYPMTNCLGPEKKKVDSTGNGTGISV